MHSVLFSIFLFILAGLFEIAGGYYVWIWLKDHKPFWVGLIGISLLVLYGFIPTLQPANFGRVYAAYGGIFIILSLVWGYFVDDQMPDRYDIAGALFCIVGAALIFYAPRGN
ncbi:YnfA family protein [Leptospira ellisii]|uniref:YnfA family protein n=1 Tax=Leptospira ellisii TaxID=2023197 RepID=A0A2N0B3T9_9LEPT|nr:YnfA family protein [Leptospira ellisii]MDV6234573.1 YnfA family protein [Leptospira ellisii]PJZ91221.1 hypothetical protein CH379_19870 [Leptospira ellisii]